MPVRPFTRLLPSTELNKPLLAFVLANAAAVIMSVNFSSSIRPFFSKTLEHLFIFFMVVDTINTKKRIRNVFIVVILSAFFISIDAGVQYFRRVDFVRGYSMCGQRLTASFRNPNDFGSWLVMVVFIILGLFSCGQTNKPILRKSGLGILVFTLVWCLGFSYSRGAWIGFFTGLIIFTVYKIIKLPKRKKVLSFLIIIVLVAGIFFLLPSTIKGRIESMGTIEGSSLVRLKLWQEALGIIKDFPVFGAGPSTYMEVSSEYSVPKGGEGTYYPHNAYLYITAEIGLVGLACFLWLLFRFYRLMFRALLLKGGFIWERSLSLLAGISAFLVHSFFDTNFYSLRLAILFWFMLGLGVSVVKADNS